MPSRARRCQPPVWRSGKRFERKARPDSGGLCCAFLSPLEPSRRHEEHPARPENPVFPAWLPCANPAGVELLPYPSVSLVMATVVVAVALGAMLLESPVHAVLCFLGVTTLAATLLLSLGFLGTATGTMWIFGGGAGLLLLTTALLLNLAPDEVGRRRFGVLRFFALALVVWIGAALVATPVAPVGGGEAGETAAVPSSSVQQATQTPELALLLAMTSLAGVAVGGLLLVRRRP